MKKALLLILGASLFPSVQAQIETGRSASYYYLQAESFYKNKEFDKALDWLQECLNVNALHADAYLTQGMIYVRQDQKQKALVAYTLYLELNPEQPEALLSRAILRYDLGQFKLAREDFQQLLKIPAGETGTIFFQINTTSPGVSKVFTTQSEGNAYLFNYLGLVCLKLEEFDSAIQWFDSAIYLASRESDYYVSRGLSREKTGDTKGAIDDYSKALELDPYQGLALHNLGALNAKQGKSSEAEAYFDQAIRQSPDLPYPYVERAFFKMNHNDWKGALDDYNQAIRLDQNDEDNFFNRAIVKGKLGDAAGALSDYTTAIRLNNGYEKAWLSRANLLYGMNRSHEAIEDYTMAIFLYPEYGSAYYNRALALHKMGRNAEACNDLKQANLLGIDVSSTIKNRICEQ